MIQYLAVNTSIFSCTWDALAVLSNVEVSSETWLGLASCSGVLGEGCSGWVKHCTYGQKWKWILVFFPAAFKGFQIPMFSVPANFCFFNCCNARKGEVCPSEKAQHEYANLFESQGLTGLRLVWILIHLCIGVNFCYKCKWITTSVLPDFFSSPFYNYILNLVLFHFIYKALQKGVSKMHSFVLKKKFSALHDHTWSLESTTRESPI